VKFDLRLREFIKEHCGLYGGLVPTKASSRPNLANQKHIANAPKLLAGGGQTTDATCGVDRPASSMRNWDSPRRSPHRSRFDLGILCGVPDLDLVVLSACYWEISMLIAHEVMVLERC